jgi:hypothetical protein
VTLRSRSRNQFRSMRCQFISCIWIRIWMRVQYFMYVKLCHYSSFCAHLHTSSIIKKASVLDIRFISIGPANRQANGTLRLFIATILSRHFVDICCQPRPWVGHFGLNTRIQAVERLFTVNKRMYRNHVVSERYDYSASWSSWFLEFFKNIFICFVWFCFSAFINLNVDHLIWVYMLEYRSLQRKSGTLMSRNGNFAEKRPEISTWNPSSSDRPAGYCNVQCVT